MYATPLKDFPTNLNTFRSGSFIFHCERIPNVTYTTQEVTLPNISMGVANFANPFKDMPIPGDKLDDQELTIKMIVDENLDNYMEIVNWITGLGFPYSHDEYYAFMRTYKNQAKPFGNDNFPQPDANSYSDIRVTLTNNNNYPIMNIMMDGCFPYSLSGFTLSTTETEHIDVVVDVSFKFRRMWFERVSASGIDVIIPKTVPTDTY